VLPGVIGNFGGLQAKNVDPLTGTQPLEKNRAPIFKANCITVTKFPGRKLCEHRLLAFSDSVKSAQVQRHIVND
jgi:hypothetical protein